MITASSAKEGLGELKSHAIDLMFLDLKMPEISGWKAAELFRQEGFKLPIVIVSANVRELDMEDNARQNHNDYLTKPFDISNLIDKLGHWLNIRWINQNDDTALEPAGKNEGNRPLVGRNQYLALKSLAEIGYLSGFTAKLEDISEHYDIPPETKKELKQLSSQIQFVKVVEKLDSLMRCF